MSSSTRLALSCSLPSLILDAETQPVPASTVVICTASLDKVERRKIFVTAKVEDQPGGLLYAEGEALFVVPKDATRDPEATQTPVVAEQLERRSSRQSPSS